MLITYKVIFVNEGPDAIRYSIRYFENGNRISCLLVPYTCATMSRNSKNCQIEE